jgi:predicted glycoside hydrolase/deacetylase ChbG (UPF0249 family)
MRKRYEEEEREIMTRRELLSAGTMAAGALLTRPGEGAADGRSAAERLGYGPEDRLLMIHADDIGMCHSVNVASTKALTEGSATCGSVMVPCPWFPEIAAWSREHPDADLGLHLTLTSEWKYYRWRPVTPVNQVKGLVDDEGFMWRAVEDVKKHASAEEVETEIRAQVERARQFGIKPTHVDSHMGTLFADPKYFEAYTRVAKDLNVMPMIPAPSLEINLQAAAMGLNYPPLAEKLKSQGYPLLGRLVTGLSGDTDEARRSALEGLVASLKPGVTELIVHLSGGEDEIQHISYSWETRFREFRLFTSPQTKRVLEEKGVKPIGYRELAKLWGK